MLRRIAFPASMLLLTGFFACSRAGKEETQPQNPSPAAEQPAATQPSAQQAATQAQPADPSAKPEAAAVRTEAAKPAPRPATPPTKVAPAEAPGRTAEAQPAAGVPGAPKAAAEPAPPPAPKTVLIPSGTRFEVRLTGPISSAENKPGDAFKAIVDKDLEIEGKVVVPRGSAVAGKLVDVKRAGRVKGRAGLSMTLTEVAVGQNSYRIQTDTLSFEAQKTTKGDAAKVGIGAAAGAIIGAIAGGGKGAAIGAAVGGGAGTATVLATKGDDMEFPAEERFTFVLKGDLEVRR